MNGSRIGDHTLRGYDVTMQCSVLQNVVIFIASADPVFWPVGPDEKKK